MNATKPEPRTAHQTETLITKIGEAAESLARSCRGHRNQRDWGRTWDTLAERFNIALAFPWQDSREVVYLTVRDRFLDAYV